MLSKSAKDSFKKLCSEHSCRCTKQRLAVFEYICGNKTHPSVNQVWMNARKNASSITRESVFRILLEFAEWGIIDRMDRIENARFDSNPEPHGHFICKKCGAVFDFKMPGNIQLPEGTDGFTPQKMELRISGICANCAAEYKTNGKNVSNNSQLPKGKTQPGRNA